MGKQGKWEEVIGLGLRCWFFLVKWELVKWLNNSSYLILTFRPCGIIRVYSCSENS